MNLDPQQAARERVEGAYAEIEAILRKHDLAAHILLYTPMVGHFRLHLEPSWCLLKWEPNGQQLRINTKEARLLVDAATLHERLIITSNMTALFSDILTQHSGAMASLSVRLDEQIGAEHTELEPVRPPTLS